MTPRRAANTAPRAPRGLTIPPPVTLPLEWPSQNFEANTSHGPHITQFQSSVDLAYERVDVLPAW